MDREDRNLSEWRRRQRREHLSRREQYPSQPRRARYEEYREPARYESNEELDEGYENDEDDAYDERNYQRRAHSASPRPVSRVPRPRSEYSDYRNEPRRSAPRSPQVRSTRVIEDLQPVPRQRQRRVWPIFLAGCASGVVLLVVAAAVVVFVAIRSAQNSGLSLPGAPSALKLINDVEQKQEVTLSTLTQVIVCDRVGNVTLKVDDTVTIPTVITQKKMFSANESEAKQEFGRIAVEVQPPTSLTKPLACTNAQPPTPTNANSAQGSPTPETTTGTPSTSQSGSNSSSTLTVNVTFPTMEMTNDAVDVTIKLPKSSVQEQSPGMGVSIEAPIGDITVNGVSGVLNIKGGFAKEGIGNGNITVTNAVLADGSRLSTNQGNVTFDGFLASAANARYTIESGHSIDVTVPESSDAFLDAHTNRGKISSDFPIQVNNNTGDAEASYCNSLNPAINTPTTQTCSSAKTKLILIVNTGDIHIHKKAAPTS